MVVDRAEEIVVKGGLLGNLLHKTTGKAQIISMTILGTSTRSLQPHVKVVMEIFMALMAIDDSLTDV